ncbi:acyl-CoA/acyl-ACP dehydrogenase [Aldersonia sp. NBC_00410]|uniref:acyl-CoA dehydrogenase family protein n=1 Tax=Aldersonia sp. NBC_00410 TaxID=2975954 RepID=UPI0022533AE9|nr:acyl-CoA dehydrogenase family protein [Aldersonia sp. NBC_00410]MCX5043351.1 acyl-CoA/acyl-ACP dehydrogenase [Aldersonia sp. NBC_00410]
MDFTPTEGQQDLEQLTRTIVEKLTSNERQRELDALPARFDEPLWRALAEAGVLASTLPENVGGNDLGVLEQTTVLRELGRQLAAVPYLPSIVLGAATLARYGNDDQREFARRAGTGADILTAALAEEANYEPSRPVTRADLTDGHWSLTGTKITVPVADRAARILVPAATDAGVAVFLVDPTADGVTVAAHDVVDHTPEFIVELGGVAGDLIGSVEQGAEILDFLLARAAVGLTASQLGTLERSLELVGDYARERIQFDRPIGSFQAVAQRLADAYIDVKGVRLALTQAAWLLSEDLPADQEANTAKFWAADAGHRVAHTVIHVHGGVGLDRDHPVHRYFLAAKHNEFALGSATDQLRRLGASLAATPA